MTDLPIYGRTFASQLVQATTDRIHRHTVATYAVIWEATRRGLALDLVSADQLLCLAALAGLEVGCTFLTDTDYDTVYTSDGADALTVSLLAALQPERNPADADCSRYRVVDLELLPEPADQLALAAVFDWAPLANLDRLGLFAQLAVADDLLRRHAAPDGAATIMRAFGADPAGWRHVGAVLDIIRARRVVNGPALTSPAEDNLNWSAQQ